MYSTQKPCILITIGDQEGEKEKERERERERERKQGSNNFVSDI